jgi:hypothetical protein
MIKKTALLLVFFIFIYPLYPVEGRGWHSSPPNYYQQHQYYRGHYSGDALFWGVTGLILGSILLSSITPPPSPRVVYVDPQTGIYNYPPNIPPGMCRWERYLLDPYGRFLLDQYGQPVKQYTLGSCQYPPSN